MFGLTRVELSVLATLQQSGENKAGWSVVSLAGKMAVSCAQVSRAVASLEKKEFVTAARSRQKLVQFSSAGHASAFLYLLGLHPHVDFVSTLSNSSLRVLSAFTGSAIAIEQMARISRTPTVTVRRTVSKLMERGILVRQEKNQYQLALSGLQTFVQAYATHSLQEKAGVDGLICCGPNAVLRTKTPIPRRFELTGVSIFYRFGVPIVQTDFQDYWFNLFDSKTKKPSLEEAVVHALVRSTLISSGREVSYAMLVLYNNWKKVDQKQLLQTAQDYCIESDARHCVNLVEKLVLGGRWPEPLVQGFRKVGGPRYPGFEEFQELVTQYA